MKYYSLEYFAVSMGAAFLVGSLLHYIGITGDWSVVLTLLTFFATWIGFNVNNATKYRTISQFVNSIEDVEKFVADVKKYSETHPIQEITANEKRLCAWFLK